ncbi:hypothetical protein BDZ91DRAFT_535763 [Kalaharituber pfeilii]|nr:hypothetical protein BDZ91DRAFT_535763 [Kalaharituber pfeilii]
MEKEEIARFEEYSIAIGACKKCFPKGSTPAQAPRPHNYRPPRRKIYYVGKYRRVRFLTLRKKRSGGLHFHWWDDTTESSVSSTASELTDSGSGSERTKRWRREDIHERRALAKETKYLAREQRRQMRYLQQQEQKKQAEQEKQEQRKQQGIFGATGAAATTLWRKQMEFWTSTESPEGYASSSSSVADNHKEESDDEHGSHEVRGQSSSAGARMAQIYYNPGFSEKGYNPEYYTTSDTKNGAASIDVTSHYVAAARSEPRGSNKVSKSRQKKKQRSAASSSDDSGLVYGDSASSASPVEEKSRSSRLSSLFGFRRRPSKKKSRGSSRKEASSSSSNDDGLAFGQYPSTSTSPASDLRRVHKRNASQHTWDTISLKSGKSITNSISESLKNARMGLFRTGSSSGRAGKEPDRSGSGIGKEPSTWHRPSGLFVRRRFSRESNQSAYIYGTEQDEEDDESAGKMFAGKNSSTESGLVYGKPPSIASSSRNSSKKHPRHRKSASIESCASNSSGGGRPYQTSFWTHSSASSSSSSEGRRTPQQHQRSGLWGSIFGTAERRKKPKKPSSKKDKGKMTMRPASPAHDDWESEEEQQQPRRVEQKRGERAAHDRKKSVTSESNVQLREVYPKPTGDPSNYDYTSSPSRDSDDRRDAHKTKQEQPRQTQPTRPGSYPEFPPSQRTQLPNPITALAAPTPSPVYTLSQQSSTVGTYTRTSVPDLPPPAPRQPDPVTTSPIGNGGPTSTRGSFSVRSETLSSPDSTITNLTSYTAQPGSTHIRRKPPTHPPLSAALFTSPQSEAKSTSFRGGLDTSNNPSVYRVDPFDSNAQQIDTRLPTTYVALNNGTRAAFGPAITQESKENLELKKAKRTASEKQVELTFQQARETREKDDGMKRQGTAAEKSRFESKERARAAEEQRSIEEVVEMRIAAEAQRIRQGEGVYTRPPGEWSAAEQRRAAEELNKRVKEESIGKFD